MSDGLLLDVRNLAVRYDTPGGSFTAVDGFNFSMAPGEAVALVGESGCGKSTSALALMRLLPSSARISGNVLFDGHDIAALSEKTMRGLRGHRMGMIFQEPMTSLNPVHRIGDQIIESLQRHLGLSKSAARKRTLDLLDLVKLPDPQRKIDEYPHQLSGGQRQRVMIAMAIACEPKLLIADEPTTALDATIQAEILKLLDGLRRQLSMGLLLISHDLTLVSNWTDKVIVMHHGQEMEKLQSRQLFSSGTHPYTKGLIGASIHLDANLHYTRQSLAEIRTGRTPEGGYVFDAIKPTTRVQPATPKTEPLLKVDNLVVEYTTRRGKFRAVDDASLSIARGESLGLVGESGSGKSTISKAIMRLVDIHSGTVSLEGKDITRMRGTELRTARQRMQMIFQDPYASLNPRHSISTILENILHLHGVNDRQDRRKRAAEALDWVRLPKAALDKYPHEFSGGQRQRIGIARALILKPPLLICDEPVSALDVSVQAQILNLLVELKGALGLSYLFISHDLAVIQYISDRVIVMKDSRIVEEGDYLSIWQNPQHPYTKTLIAAVTKAA